MSATIVERTLTTLSDQNDSDVDGDVGLVTMLAAASVEDVAAVVSDPRVPLNHFLQSLLPRRFYSGAKPSHRHRRQPEECLPVWTVLEACVPLLTFPCRVRLMAALRSRRYHEAMAGTMRALLLSATGRELTDLKNACDLSRGDGGLATVVYSELGGDSAVVAHLSNPASYPDAPPRHDWRYVEGGPPPSPPPAAKAQPTVVMSPIVVADSPFVDAKSPIADAESHIADVKSEVGGEAHDMAVEGPEPPPDAGGGVALAVEAAPPPPPAPVPDTPPLPPATEASPPPSLARTDRRKSTVSDGTPPMPKAHRIPRSRSSASEREFVSSPRSVSSSGSPTARLRDTIRAMEARVAGEVGFKDADALERAKTIAGLIPRRKPRRGSPASTASPAGAEASPPPPAAPTAVVPPAPEPATPPPVPRPVRRVAVSPVVPQPGRRLRKVLCDIDDTLYPNLHDTSFRTGIVYPGCLALLDALKTGHADLGQPPGQLVVVTARPPLAREVTHTSLRKRGLGPVTVLAGSMPHLLSVSRMAEKKLLNIRGFLALFPEVDLVWVGDSGQGDIRVGLTLIEEARTAGLPPPPVFIHDVVDKATQAPTTPLARRVALKREGVFVVDSYVEAARLAFQLGLITAAGARKVAAAAAAELDNALYDPAEEGTLFKVTSWLGRAVSWKAERPRRRHHELSVAVAALDSVLEAYE